MKKIKNILFVLIIAMAFACSKDDSNPETDNNQILEGGTIYTAQIVEIDIESVTSETYQGILGDTTIELRKTTENTLAFFVEPDFIAGSTTLTIEGLDNLKVNYTIEETVLTQNVEETIQPYFDQILIERQALFLANADEKAIQLIDSFIDLYPTLDEQQKENLSIFYEANKNLIDAAINGDANRFNSNLASQFTSCEASIYLTGILGVFTTISTSLPFTQIATPILAVSTGILLAETYENCSSLSSATIKNTFVQAEDQIFNSGDFERNSANESVINFSSDDARDISIQIQNRTMLPGDSNDSNNFISTYFSATSSFNALVIQKMNAAINYLNTEWSIFFNIEPYQEITVSEMPTTETTSMTSDDYNNFTFSVSNSNLNLESISFSDGGINAKIKIVDESAMNGEFETATLDFTYQDDFNSFSGSFDIKVSIFSLVGTTWKFCFVSDGFCEEVDTITFLSDGTVSTPGLQSFDEVVENYYVTNNNFLEIKVTVSSEEYSYCDAIEDYIYFTEIESDTFTLQKVSDTEYSGTLTSSEPAYTNPNYPECSTPAYSDSESIIFLKL
ncbi:hypothetical protein [Psychroflexus aestuariivivens]|uniref:hypothetical protein n=1 Tax=Psychroflexus aestuariivivens TaxID=1795040 RepID=UPI000FD81AD8|nr:hypothetical protein [Psychroflexus aestuariivivens]